MTWLWVLLIVIGAVFVISLLHSGDADEAANNAAGAGFGCGMLILQIFFSVLSLWILFKVAQFLFN